MPDIPNEIALVIIWGLVQVIQKGLDVFAGWRKDDAKADEISAAREEQLMKMLRQTLDVVLTAQHTRYSDFVQHVHDGFKDVAEKIQANFTSALTQLTEQMTEQMATVTEQRNQKLAAIHADVKVVPQETARHVEPHINRLSGEIQAMPGVVWKGPFGELIPALEELLEPGTQADNALLAELQQLGRKHEAEERRRKAEDARRSENEQAMRKQLSAIAAAIAELQTQQNRAERTTDAAASAAGQGDGDAVSDETEGATV